MGSNGLGPAVRRFPEGCGTIGGDDGAPTGGRGLKRFPLWLTALATRLHDYRQLLLLTTYLLVFGTALFARLTYARLAEYPGHADEAFYYTVAENLADGRGFVIDYVWHYLAPPRTITHPSNDYWLPFASLLMSLPMRVLGKSVFAALLPGVAAGLGLSLVVYSWGKVQSSSTLVAVGAASLMLFEPQLFAASLATETLVYFALLATCGFWFMYRGRANPRFFLLAAICAGLGHLTRPDGIFLLLTLGVVIWLSPHSRATKLRYALLSPLLYLVVLSPWLLLNYGTLGSPLPPGALKIMFAAEYEDRYAYAKELSLRAYLESGLATIVSSKLEAAAWNLKTLVYLGELLWVPTAIGILESLRREQRHRLRIYLPVLVFLGALFAVHTVMPFSFALVNSAVAIVPFLVLVSAETIGRHIRSTAMAVLLLALLGAHLYARAFPLASTNIALNNAVGRQLAPLGRLVTEDAGLAPGEEIVIMTRIPWEVHLSTRYKAVQIPNDDLPTILEVARRYGANYLLLPAERKALQGLYEGTVTDRRFRFVAALPYSDPSLGPHTHVKLFRIARPE